MRHAVEHIADRRRGTRHTHTRLPGYLLPQQRVRHLPDLSRRRHPAEPADQLLPLRQPHLRTDMQSVEAILPVHFPHHEPQSVSGIAFLRPPAYHRIRHPTHHLRDNRPPPQLPIRIPFPVNTPGTRRHIPLRNHTILNSHTFLPSNQTIDLIKGYHLGYVSYHFILLPFIFK